MEIILDSCWIGKRVLECNCSDNVGWGSLVGVCLHKQNLPTKNPTSFAGVPDIQTEDTGEPLVACGAESPGPFRCTLEGVL